MKFNTVVSGLSGEPSTTNKCFNDLVNVMQGHGARNLEQQSVKEIRENSAVV
jgi:hypothetical protein